ncbi:anti-sigma factor domain-containing protein [Nocardia sp. NPDC051750]|uniref:anti-sigma factor n=1 Tax=Nocardia sp. NPDC051750 TaxID=3364325 RepID=UPI0037A54713
MPDTSPPDSPGSNGDLVDLAIPYALDAVSAAESDDIEQRLRTADPADARSFENVVRDIREAMGALSILDAQAPPARVEARILAALDSRPGARSDVHTGERQSASAGRDQLPGTDTPASRDSAGTGSGVPIASGASAGDDTDELERARQRRIRRVGWFAAAAAVVVAIGIGIGILDQRTGEPPGGTVSAQEVRDQPDARTSTTELGGGTLTVHVSAELGAATVSFDAVAAPPDGSDYQLWLIDAAGVPRSAGVLDRLPAEGSPYVTEFAVSDQLAVTLEPDGGSPAPTGTPLGAIALG